MTNDADDERGSNDELKLRKSAITRSSLLSRDLAYLADIFPLSIREIRGHLLAAALPH